MRARMSRTQYILSLKEELIQLSALERVLKRRNAIFEQARKNRKLVDLSEQHFRT